MGVTNKPLGPPEAALVITIYAAHLGHKKYGMPAREAITETLRWANQVQRYGVEHCAEWSPTIKAYRRNIANNLCPVCGKRPPELGVKICAECRERYRDNYHSRRRRKRSGEDT